MPELDKLYSSEFEKQLDKLQTSFDKLNQDLIQSAKGLKAVDTSLKAVEKTQKNLNIAQKEAERYKQEILKTDQQIIKTQQQEQRLLVDMEKKKQAVLNTEIKLNREKEKQAKNSAKATKEAQKEASAYHKLNKELGIARQKAKDLGAATNVNTKEFRKAQKEVLKLDRRLKKLDNSLGLNQRSVGKYSNALKGSLGSMLKFGAGMIGITAIFRVFGNSIKTIANFEKAMDKVQAVTGATSKQIKELTNDAKRLGSITSKSATEVSGLQLEFSKLGFSTSEILAATEATISLSIAAGTDLADSAVVAASTVRGFGLSATETQRVVDVMAKSFASSALDLEKFKTGMGAVAPVAKASGKSIEFATAQLSVLNDAGIDASTAGTSLRNMFLELNKQGLTWEQGLEKINTSTNKNVTALELFGKRGATAALVLADNVDKATELEEAYNGAAGSAKEMADIMEDNLLGDVDKLSSAWEGFILGLNKGDGVISNFFRKLIDFTTKVVSGFAMMNEELGAYQDRLAGDVIKRLKDEVTEYNKHDEEIYKNRVDMLNRMVKAEQITIEVAKVQQAKYLKELEESKESNYKKTVQREIKAAEFIISNLENEAQGNKYAKDFIEETNLAKRKKLILLFEENKLVLQNGENLAKWVAGYDNAKGSLEGLNAELENSARKNYKDLIIEETVETKKSTDAIKDKTKARKEWNDEVIDEDDVLDGADYYITKQVEANKAAKAQMTKDDEEFQNHLTTMNDEIEKDVIDAADKDQKLKETNHQKDLQRIEDIKEATVMGLDAVGMIGNEMFARRQMQYDEELSKVQNRYDIDMALAGDNELAKRQATEKRIAEENKIKTKQAKLDRNAALFNIAINTAQGVSMAWGQTGIFGIAAQIPVIAMGILQAGLVASRPMPKFDKGTKSAPKGFIEVAEKRPEFAIKDNKMIYIDKPTVTDQLSGAEIIGGAESEIMRAAMVKGKVSDTDVQMLSGFREIRDSIKDLKINVGFDHFGRAYTEKNNRGRTTYADYYS